MQYKLAKNPGRLLIIFNVRFYRSKFAHLQDYAFLTLLGVLHLKYTPVLIAISIYILGYTTTAIGQTYPVKPIRLVVAQAPGSTTDMLGRLLAKGMSEKLAQQVLVDNRPGAGGTLGADVVAKSAADGYTLLLGNISTHGVNPSLYSKLPYNAVHDFAAISITGITENVLVIHPSVPAKSVKELVALAKRRPDAMTFSSAGNGSAQHMAVELFKGMAGVNLLHVAYKGGNPAITSVISGETIVMIPTLPLAFPHAKSGKIRMVAVTSAKRLENLPNLPAVAETLPGYEMVSWFGMLAPSGTSPETIRKLNSSVVSTMESPSVRQQLNTSGLTPRTSTAEEFAVFIKAEIAKWTKVAVDSKLRAN